jgi:acyl-CoA synthetase (AMP-forming)/AMP-acid ligase II
VRLDRRGRALTFEAGTGRPPALPPAAEAGLVLYTSGSSGDPKAVVLPAAGLLYVIDRLIARFGLGPATVAAVTLPLHHTMALNTQLLPTVFAGGRAVVLESGPALGRTYRDLLSTGANFVALIAELLRPCLAEQRRRGLPAASGVEEMQLSGGMILGEHLAMARQLFPAARLHKGYGLTEAIRVTMTDSGDPRFSDPDAGFPLPGQEVAVTDEEGRALPPGRRGQIVVRGPNVMLGYEGEASQPFADGWLLTGDLGRLTADGRLTVEGRRDGVFKSYGRRIATAEIERAALACPEVATAKCIPVACPVRGQRPLLFVEPAGPGPLDGGLKSRLEATLRRALLPYKVPREIVLVEAVPRSATGKVSHRALAELWRQGPPVTDLGRGPRGCRFKRLVLPASEAP